MILQGLFTQTNIIYFHVFSFCCKWSEHLNRCIRYLHIRKCAQWNGNRSYDMQVCNLQYMHRICRTKISLLFVCVLNVHIIEHILYFIEPFSYKIRPFHAIRLYVARCVWYIINKNWFVALLVLFPISIFSWFIIAFPFSIILCIYGIVFSQSIQIWYVNINIVNHNRLELWSLMGYM